MKRNQLLLGLVLVLALALVWSGTALADKQTYRTAFPSAEDPGFPFYARLDPAPPAVLIDGEWAAVLFYREPTCVPAGFNLLQFFDFVTPAFACPHTVHGHQIWEGLPFSSPPKVSVATGNGAVPVWFVPLTVMEAAKADGELTIAELESLDGLLKGYASQFNEAHHPTSDPELGGGGHPVPKLIINAHGWLEDGRTFSLHLTWVDGQVQSSLIAFN